MLILLAFSCYLDYCPFVVFPAPFILLCGMVTNVNVKFSNQCRMSNFCCPNVQKNYQITPFFSLDAQILKSIVYIKVLTLTIKFFEHANIYNLFMYESIFRIYFRFLTK